MLDRKRMAARDGEKENKRVLCAKIKASVAPTGHSVKASHPDSQGDGERDRERGKDYGDTPGTQLATKKQKQHVFERTCGRV